MPDPTMIQQLFEQYGLPGIVVGVLLLLIFQQRKRIAALERQQDETQRNHIINHKEMVEDYVELVKNQIQVLSQLTGCIKSLKETVIRLERKVD